jgi:hypothetical protein
MRSKVNPLNITFGVRVESKRNIGSYPLLEDLEANLGLEKFELGYNFRDYGMLSLSIVKRLDECNTTSLAPQSLVKQIRDFYRLPDLVGSTTRAGGKFTEWMIDTQCPDVNITSVVIEHGKKKKVLPGPIGLLFMRAADRSSNPTQALEDLIILKVLARKMNNFGRVLSALHTQGAIDCLCSSTKGQEVHDLRGKTTQLLSRDACVTMYDAYLVHCETPQVTPFAISSNNPLAISSLLYNELYRLYHGLRVLLQMWLNESLQDSQSLAKVDPYEVSDRMPREISRAFEKLHLLQSLHEKRFVSIPDRLLSDLVNLFREATIENASSKGNPAPREEPLSSFVRKVKEEFRILVNPDDIVRYLEDSVDHVGLGIDLETARGYLVSDYLSFTERLENLGLATIRPDGDVMIRIA